MELDEQWAFVGCKQKNVDRGRRDERGDSWLFIALDATSKAVLSWSVGKRTAERTSALAQRPARAACQPPADHGGRLRALHVAVLDAFGERRRLRAAREDLPDDAGNEAAVRYSPGSIRGSEKTLGLRRARRGEDQHELRGALQPLDPDAHAPVHAADERFQQEDREPRGRGRAPHRLLQPRPHPRDDPVHARHGARRHGSPVDDRRVDRGRARAPEPPPVYTPPQGPLPSA